MPALASPAPTFIHAHQQDPPGSAIRFDDVSRVYGRGRKQVRALDGVSLPIPAGRWTAIMGPSGSGKSTLLHCAAGLDRPTSGRVFLGDDDLAAFNETQLTKLRRKRLGFVFQSFNLIGSLTAEQNVSLPLRLDGRHIDREEVRDALATVGLADRAKHRPAQLSGGQQQRVAIARALITRPEVLFADEPTGALDLRTAREILGLLRTAVDSLGRTVVMVTHDPAAASYADSVVFLADGRVVDQLDGALARAIEARATSLEERSAG
ncbi:MAG: ABC transporter ATP-binding protein [Chloroflexi bacterium]|nr:ABC transporter ATP-binding protein [Chloroflexota bacterium]PWB43405.1 MAG: ABC transporter [Dehalococcoidia bacterium]